jgi:hypothetical protein
LWDVEIPSVVMAAKMAETYRMEPRNLAKAKQGPEWIRWQEEMEVKKATLEKFECGTWRSPHSM